jgi:hypothetical protein
MYLGACRRSACSWGREIAEQPEADRKPTGTQEMSDEMKLEDAAAVSQNYRSTVHSNLHSVLHSVLQSVFCRFSVGFLSHLIPFAFQLRILFYIPFYIPAICPDRLKIH